MTCTCARLRASILKRAQPLEHVQEVGVEAGRRVVDWRRVAACAALPTRTMKTGMSGAVRSRTSVEKGSMGKTKNMYVSGTRAAKASWGRYWE